MLKKSGITRVVVILSLVSCFADIASEMLYPVMPVYLTSIGFTALWIGLLEGFAEAIVGLSKGYFGSLSDKLGTRMPFVRLGYTLSAVSKPMMAVFTFPLWIFFARFIDRSGKGIRTGARDALLSDESTSVNKGKIFGFHRALDTFGASIGPLIALVFLYYYPGQYKMLFFLAFAPGLVSILLTFFIKEKKTAEKKETKQNPLNFIYWKSANVTYKTLVTGLLVFVLFNSSDVFLLMMVKHAGFSDHHTIGIYVFYNLVFALFALPLGALADRIGMKTTLCFGLILFIMVYAGMAMLQGIFMLITLFFLYGIYAAATEGVSKAWIAKITPASETASAIGFYSGMSSIAVLLASSIAGFIWVQFGPGAAFLTTAVGAFAALLFIVFRVKEERAH